MTCQNDWIVRIPHLVDVFLKGKRRVRWKRARLKKTSCTPFPSCLTLTPRIYPTFRWTNFYIVAALRPKTEEKIGKGVSMWSAQCVRVCNDCDWIVDDHGQGNRRDRYGYRDWDNRSYNRRNRPNVTKSGRITKGRGTFVSEFFSLRTKYFVITNRNLSNWHCETVLQL